MIDLRLGNIIDVLPTLEANTFDGCLCDPPYELGFMGKHWDASGITYNVDLWRQVYRALKPGAYLLTFGGTRTSHRLACAIEDAGFEIRDTIDWVYGSGFPKSLDVSKAIDKAAGAEREVIGIKQHAKKGFGDNLYAQDPANRNNERIFGYGEEELTTPATSSARTFQGYGTALKPAHEPIIVARKPLSEATVAANCQKWGTGALNIDASRIGVEQIPISNHNKTIGGNGKYHGGIAMQTGGATGRFPANLITDGSAEVVAMFPQTISKYAPSKAKTRGNSDIIRPTDDGRGVIACNRFVGDSGSASRFFKSCPLDDDDYLPLYYCAKASKAERDAGCEGMEERTKHILNGGIPSAVNSDPRGMSGGGDRQAKNHHPTVKPISLTRYLATLILPPIEYAPRKMLVPFAGVASEMIGAMLAGWDEIIGIEREAEYCEIGRARLEYWQTQLQLTLPMVTA